MKASKDADAPPEAPAATPAAPAAAAQPLPDELSFTSLSELERCGYRYYLERVLHIGEARVPAAHASSASSLGARERGTLVHRLLEQVDFARPAAPSQERVAELARELGMRVPAAERARLTAMIAAALRAQPAARVAAARSVKREYPFAFSLHGRQPLISGVIDVLAEEHDGGAVVLDYKSTALTAGEDLHALVEREYALQRQLYALAVLLGGAPHVEIIHWFLERPDEHVAVRYAAPQRGSIESLLGEALARVAHAGFSVSSRPHRGLCLTCPARSELCSWPSSETLRETPPEA